uniref:Uncharacterized protein n=1 Tax=Romanomermis culicivorax TaxID=13658 RepID=A0A915IDF7_ROMCU
MAIQSYSRTLESVRLTPGLPEVQEALRLFYEVDLFDVMENGWALKKHKICHPLMEKQRQYLLEKHNSGIIYHQKFNAEVVTEEMRQKLPFVGSDLLTPTTNYWIL